MHTVTHLCARCPLCCPQRAVLHDCADGAPAANELWMVAVDEIVLALDQGPNHALCRVRPRADELQHGHG
eukprot:1159792-Pelagomonas_calceolata.AAC.17